MSEGYGQMSTYPGLGQNPYVPPQAQPRKRLRELFIFCLGAAVGVLGVLGAVVVVEDFGPVAQQARMSEMVTVGDFRIIVQEVERKGPGETGSAEWTPRGEFVFVTVLVQNVESSAQTFEVGRQKLLAGGSEYDAVPLGEGGRMFERIPPGATINGLVVFDVPKGTPLEAIVLHSGAFSWGAKVTLSRS
ncbi:DUF4352 domain-containing protein [Nonomuraea sp. NPDC050790]|uniref:DUF4352 domain-containing protein n=1 Tax=Nonomuraea sp. NPDC050790 TaxID=3364371 RepID=UPI00379B60EE